jgi:bacteriocin-like protein
MSFDIVNTLEIPQGATELTTSQLKQISGGHDGQENKCKGKSKKHNKENDCGKKRKNNDCGKGDNNW